MAFLEHSVFQNKDIGVVFSTLFIYTLDVKWELLEEEFALSFDMIYWENWGRMHTKCEERDCADVLLYHAMIWSHHIKPDAAKWRGEKDSPEPFFLCFSFEWAKCSSVYFFSDFWVFMRVRVLRSRFQILSQFRKIIQTKKTERLASE